MMYCTLYTLHIDRSETKIQENNRWVCIRWIQYPTQNFTKKKSGVLNLTSFFCYFCFSLLFSLCALSQRILLLVCAHRYTVRLLFKKNKYYRKFNLTDEMQVLFSASSTSLLFLGLSLCMFTSISFVALSSFLLSVSLRKIYYYFRNTM